jgi:hypothetical protein
LVVKVRIARQKRNNEIENAAGLAIAGWEVAHERIGRCRRRRVYPFAIKAIALHVRYRVA